jgi:hypothetical protein
VQYEGDTTEDVARTCFDAQGLTLRARFGGIKVIEGANRVQLAGLKVGKAVEEALVSEQFKSNRGVVFGILGSGAHALGIYNIPQGDGENREDHFLWLDPNYGVWRMDDLSIIEAMTYLFEETGGEGEEGVYQVNGDLERVPTLFEYSVWAVNEAS